MSARGSFDIILFGPFRLDRRGGGLFRVAHDGGLTQIVLGSRALGVLDVLVARHGDLVLKDEIMAAAWPDTTVEEANLSVQVAAIRRAVDASRSSVSYIQTVPGRGYRFVGGVTRLAAPDAGRPPASGTAIPSAATARRWVGREAALETLENLLRQSFTGRRQTVFITGEAGIGKTTLVEMAMERIAHHGLEVLWGRCTELFGTNEAFLPLIDALREQCRGAGGAALTTALRDHAPTWLAQMPGLLGTADRTAFENEVFGATRERMLREFCDLIEVLSADRPWVIIVEDLHWSDFATLDVLSRLARRGRKASVLVMATYRPVDVIGPEHPLRTIHQDLRIHGHCSELALGGLSLANVEQYLTLRFGETGPIQTLAAGVFQRTEGQPLFIVSLVDHFIAQYGMVDSGNGLEGLPGGLRDMITGQIDRLTAGEQILLETASAAGVQFSAALVAAAIGQDSLDVEQTFEALARNGGLVSTVGISEWPDGTVSGLYMFQHALYQEVLYRRVAPGRLVQLHNRLGERLERAYNNRTAEIASILAPHFETARDPIKAVQYLGEAALHAAKRFGNAEASNYLTRALDLVDRLPAEHRVAPRMALLQRRSFVRRSAGDLAGSLADLNQMISSAAAAGQHRQEVNGLLALSRFSLHTDRRLSLRASEQALAKSIALDDTFFKGLAQGTSASTNLYLKEWTDLDAGRCRLALELIAGSREHGMLIRRYAMESILKCWTSDYQDCRVAATHGKELAKDVGDAFTYTLFNVMESTARLHLGEWRVLRRGTEAAMAMAERNANQPARVLCQLMTGWLHVEALDFEGAKHHCEGIPESVFEANQFPFFIQRSLLAKIYLGLRDYPRALVQINAIFNKLDAEGGGLDFTIYTHFYHSVCEYWLAAGDLTQAHENALRLYRYTAGAPDRNHLTLAHRLFAKIAIAGGNRPEAEAQLAHAVATLGNADLPLAAWRVYLTAAAFHASAGAHDKAADYRGRGQDVVHTLAANFDLDDPLRSTLLTGFATESRCQEEAIHAASTGSAPMA